MNGELSSFGECLLVAITLLYSLTGVMIGRRAPFPASVAAYAAAVAIWVALPLLAEANLHRVDHTLGIVGVGLLLAHVAFMVHFCGLLLTVVLMTDHWAWRHRLAIGGTGVLTAVFVLLWFYVTTLPLPDPGLVFYGIRAGHPPVVLWMNISMGAGLVYIAAWNLVEFTRFLQGARTSYEQGHTAVAMVLYALSALGGTFTIVEAVGRQQGWDVTGIPQVKAPLALLVSAAAVGVLVTQIWLRPLWRHRRQWLTRYLQADLMQLRHDLLNLSAAQAELYLDIHHTAYANRTLVEAVAAQCHAAGISPARHAIARMATCLLTFQRDNLLQDPSYGHITSWDSLMEEAAAEIDQAMAMTAWERALRDSYVSQHVYIVMFLVLDSPAYREKLLINERPRVQAWHAQLADMIATVMQEHGQSTPRGVALVQRGMAKKRFTWRRA
ncbi:MAG TPA: hypothetical protein VI542_36215 [Candidatus Tectomicrobia bacterium]